MRPPVQRPVLILSKSYSAASAGSTPKRHQKRLLSASDLMVTEEPKLGPWTPDLLSLNVGNWMIAHTLAVVGLAT